MHTECFDKSRQSDVSFIPANCDNPICTAQVPGVLPLSGLSTQLSMAQPDMLLELLSSDTKLSIFDDVLTRPDVSPAGVIAKVATAAKGWQKYKSTDSRTQQDSRAVQPPASGDESGQQISAGNVSDRQSGPHNSSVVPELLDEMTRPVAAADSTSTAEPDDANSSAATVAAADATADAASHAAEGTAGTVLNDQGIVASSSAARHKVGFAEPAHENFVESAVAESTESSQTMADIQKAEQQAAAADLRARVAAGMRRCVFLAHSRLQQ